MIILYKNKAVKEQFSSEYKSKWRYPERVKNKLLSAEKYIKESKTFIDILSFAPFRLEKLKGKRKDEWSIRLGNTGYRVTLIPCDENENLLVDGDIISKAKYIEIVMVMEVSNHYE